MPAVVKKHKRNISPKRDRKRVVCDICTYQNNNNNIELYLYDHTSTHTLLQKLLYHSQLSTRNDEIFFGTGSKSDFFAVQRVRDRKEASMALLEAEKSLLRISVDHVC